MPFVTAVVELEEGPKMATNILIENPTFDSQTKETLTTPSDKFGSKCSISDKFIEKLAKTGKIGYN